MFVSVGKHNDGGEDFARWLRTEMIRCGYEVGQPRAGGQMRLAREAGVSASLISRALNEGHIPDLGSLRSIGRVLGYSLGEMLVAAGQANPDELPARRPDEMGPELRDEGERQLWEGLHELSGEERDSILNMIRVLRSRHDESARRESDDRRRQRPTG